MSDVNETVKQFVRYFYRHIKAKNGASSMRASCSRWVIPPMVGVVLLAGAGRCRDARGRRRAWGVRWREACARD